MLTYETCHSDDDEDFMGELDRIVGSVGSDSEGEDDDDDDADEDDDQGDDSGGEDGDDDQGEESSGDGDGEGDGASSNESVAGSDASWEDITREETIG